MSVLRILNVGSDGTLLIDWGTVVLNHWMPVALRENPAMPDSEALALIEAMRPAPVDPVQVPSAIVGLMVAPDPAATERAWRDSELATVVGLRDRHRDQVEIGGTTTLSTNQFKALLVYMQTLRDWPQSPVFPDSQYRPVKPIWLDEQAE